MNNKKKTKRIIHILHEKFKRGKNQMERERIHYIKKKEVINGEFQHTYQTKTEFTTQKRVNKIRACGFQAKDYNKINPMINVLNLCAYNFLLK